MYIHKIVYSMVIAWTCFSCHLSKDNIKVIKDCYNFDDARPRHGLMLDGQAQVARVPHDSVERQSKTSLAGPVI